MTYSRPCGVDTAECAAAECVCAESSVDTVNGPEKTLCDFDLCDAADDDFPCCATPVQRARNHSRED